MPEETSDDKALEDLYEARELLGHWGRYYNEERLHFALNYLRPVDYYRGNPEALLPERRSKLRATATRRREVKRQIGLTTINRGVYHFPGRFIRKRLKHYREIETITGDIKGTAVRGYYGDAFREKGIRYIRGGKR